MNIPVFYASDNNYAPYLVVAIKSVCENTKSDIDFYILDGGLDKASKESVIKTIGEYAGCSIEFITIDNKNAFNDCIENLHFTKAVYWRLLIPNLKPNLKKAIYLDIDTIINMDIKELFNQDLEQYVIGAIYEEMQENYHSITSKKNLKIPKEHKYFNSGVLLIDCDKWREEKVTDKILKAYTDYKSRIFFPDQDLLNIVFSPNNYKQLDKFFNYFSQNPFSKEEKIIYHYDGCIKPWEISQNLNSTIIDYMNIWWEYAQKTPCINLIKEKCIYKDQLSFRIARVKKAHEMLNRAKVANQSGEQHE